MYEVATPYTSTQITRTRPQLSSLGLHARTVEPDGPIHVLTAVCDVDQGCQKRGLTMIRRFNAGMVV